MRMFDVIVVGGGIAGLTAAAFAARRGANVILLEASGTFGGRARTRTVSGYHFNQGAHALYRDGLLDEILGELGVNPGGQVPPLEGGFFVVGDELHQAPFSAAGLVSTRLLTAGEKVKLALILRRLRDGSIENSPGATLQDTLTELSRSPKVRAVLATLVRLTSYVHAPQLADGPALLDQLRGALMRNVRYLDGGWGAMIEALHAICVARGATLRSGSPVASIAQHDAAWNARLRDGSVLGARSVILAMNPAQAAALHPCCGRLDELTDAVPARVACLDLGLAKLPRPDMLFALAVDRPLYFSVHSAAARLAPEGASLVHALRYLAPGEQTDHRDLLAELEGFVDLLQPGWRAHEEARQFLAAMPAVSSIPLAARRGMLGRPCVAVEGTEGLFVAGDWVGPVGMLADAAAASGRTAGELAAAFAKQGSDSRDAPDELLLAETRNG
ncbi:phytoene desaturase family protein [Sphingomonas lycopersici]|nr:FAD-dependent oxidoreductase [Sphingomonas lycopersici]